MRVINPIPRGPYSVSEPNTYVGLEDILGFSEAAQPNGRDVYVLQYYIVPYHAGYPDLKSSKDR